MLYHIFRCMHYIAYSTITNEDAILLPQAFPLRGDKILFLVILVLIAFFTVLYFLALMKYRKERLLADYRTEQRISKKIHDEIANELYCTINQVETKPVISGPDREDLIEKLNTIYSSTRDLSRETATIDTGARFSRQLKEMINGYNGKDINIIVKDIDFIKWSSLDNTIKIAVYRVVQELMVNMKKHSNASVIILEFSHSGKNLSVKYKDNGKGLPDKHCIKNGLANVENRMETIRGTATFGKCPGDGLHLSLTFPANTPYV